MSAARTVAKDVVLLVACETTAQLGLGSTHHLLLSVNPVKNDGTYRGPVRTGRHFSHQRFVE
jgi:hypothetical protein